MHLREEIKKLPENPGCYIYRNQNNKVIYVGKAKNLKRRVSNYFNGTHNNKTTLLVRDIVTFETIITQNEKEALLLEHNLIKKYKPRYNISLNDDRHYPYIIITNEKDPKYRYVRSYQKNSLRVFGPLPDGSSAREVMKTMERLFPLRRCEGNIGRPCLYYHIDQCSGACFKEVPKSWYDSQIANVEHFFKGHPEQVIETLTEKMNFAANNLQFEEANRIKSLLSHINLTTAKQDVELNDDLNRDVFSYIFDEEYFCICVLFYRGGKLLSKDFYIDKYFGQDATELLNSYIVQVYAKNMLPDQIIVPEEMSYDLQINDNVELLGAAYEPQISLLNLAINNAHDELRKAKIKSATINYNESDLLIHLQQLLKLPSYPYHIEVFDIANILNELVTGAMVVFKGGKPSYNDFRKYNINIQEPDDYHRMQNVIYRRYQKALVENKETPDLIIVDGGKIQVNAARSILKDLNLNIPVIGLVKDNNHKTDHICDLDNNDVFIKKQSPLFNLLVKFQERVHDFAITSFRKRQTKSLVTNEIENVKGVGKVLVKKINAKYNTLSQLKKATYEELLEITTNKTTAQNILNYIIDLKNKDNT